MSQTKRAVAATWNLVPGFVEGFHFFCLDFLILVLAYIPIGKKSQNASSQYTKMPWQFVLRALQLSNCPVMLAQCESLKFHDQPNANFCTISKMLKSGFIVASGANIVTVTSCCAWSALKRIAEK